MPVYIHGSDTAHFHDIHFLISFVLEGRPQWHGFKESFLCFRFLTVSVNHMLWEALSVIPWDSSFRSVEVRGIFFLRWRACSTLILPRCIFMLENNFLVRVTFPKTQPYDCRKPYSVDWHGYVPPNTLNLHVVMADVETGGRGQAEICPAVPLPLALKQ